MINFLKNLFEHYFPKQTVTATPQNEKPAEIKKGPSKKRTPKKKPKAKKKKK